jgi:LysR family carnitine catabolism transcriptional activator
MNLNLHQLDAFVRVAQLGGFSRAAAQMHLSQAGLSILVRKLEQRLALTLFERTTRNVTLSPAGRAVLPIAERMLQDAHALLHHAHLLPESPSHRIVFALPPLLAATVLPLVLEQFRRQHPGAVVIFRECVREEQVSRIFSRDVDFALGFGVEPNAQLDCEPIGKDQMCIAVPVDHPLAARSRVRWIDLLEYPIIINAPGSGARTLAENAFAAVGEALRPAFETSNHLTAVELARRNLGAAVVSSCVRPLAGSMHVAVRTLSAPVVSRSLQLARRRGTTLSSSASDFVELFAKVLASGQVQPRRAERKD